MNKKVVITILNIAKYIITAALGFLGANVIS